MDKLNEHDHHVELICNLHDLQRYYPQETAILDTVYLHDLTIDELSSLYEELMNDIQHRRKYDRLHHTYYILTTLVAKSDSLFELPEDLKAEMVQVVEDRSVSLISLMMMLDKFVALVVQTYNYDIDKREELNQCIADYNNSERELNMISIIAHPSMVKLLALCKNEEMPTAEQLNEPLVKATGIPGIVEMFADPNGECTIS